MKNTLNLTGVILCAGKGTRIKQLLFNKPKTLLEIQGQPIIYHQLNYDTQDSLYYLLNWCIGFDNTSFFGEQF